MKVLAFGDCHFHSTHRFSQITSHGYTVRELEHLQCADIINSLVEEEGIDRIVCLGDMWGPVGDSMSCQTMCAIMDFFEKISKSTQVDVIIGNHDIVSSTENGIIHKLYMLNQFDNVNLYDKPVEVGKAVFMPYCSSDEYAEAFLNNILDKKDKCVLSHMELKDINLGNGIFTTKGVSLNTLRKFKMTLQGHYHSGGNYGKNIQLTGSSQRLSFKDKGISRNNIIIYDTDTGEIGRKSFNCPDWFTFNDDNIEDILKIDTNNYVKLELSCDFLLTQDMKDKIDMMKGKDIHFDVMRIGNMNKNVSNLEFNVEDELDIVKTFIESSDFDANMRDILLEEGKRLINIVKK